ncbi:hypothetical protein [Arsukibacterium sp.]|uniref:hypothetical protein n=1 Tax=Arsukibacterium sp. TaxID=1977258 RepID=UPI00299EA23C|nr:hypothetical protein [Arsukibacterium sp.]MDX1678991.1 hypothetical protein [Arsukibacterium sp.]
MKFFYTIVLIGSLMLSMASHAKNNDQTLTIRLDAAGCITAIEPPADDNCQEPGNSGRAGCGSTKDCACGARNKHIVWQTQPAKAFAISFYDTSPFQPGCRLAANDNGMLRCLITADAEGEYDYGVTMAGCPEYDPRIVVRAQ